MLVIGLPRVRGARVVKIEHPRVFPRRAVDAEGRGISIVGSSLSAALHRRAGLLHGGNSRTSSNVGGLIAVFVVGFLFVPGSTTPGPVTIYGFSRSVSWDRRGWASAPRSCSTDAGVGSR